MRVIMTGGGTGGHIYPAIAIADEFRRRFEDAEILFVGAEVGMEREIVPENGYDLEFIVVDGFYRKQLYKNIEVFNKLRKASKRSKEIIKAFNPDVVIGTGGYASAAVVRTAQKMKIPTYIHEQNAYPGMTNRMLERHANRIFLGFDAAAEHFKNKDKLVNSGNPVRAVFSQTGKEEARKALGFKKSDFVLLAFGGSQGAGRVNKAMIEVIETFNGVDNFKICVGAGKYYYESMLEEFKEKNIELHNNIIIKEYISDMEKYLAASDLVVSRSGALTVAEVTICGKPAIFIPSPNVTGNHQYHNAMAVARNGGAMVIEEEKLENGSLVSEILKLKNNPEILKDMAAKSEKCAPVDAAGIICDTIINDIAK